MSRTILDDERLAQLEKIHEELMHDNSSSSFIRARAVVARTTWSSLSNFTLNSTTTLPPIFNTTTRTTTTFTPTKSTSIGLTIGTAVCAGILILIFITCGIYCFCRWFKRKLELKRDLTPYYSYDQSEAEVSDGILYSTDTNSADMLCVVADENIVDDNEISFANTNYFASSEDKLLKSNELTDIGSVSV